LAHGNRKAGGKSGDPVEAPTFRQALGKRAESPIQRQEVVVADNEIVRNIKLGKRTAQAIVAEVDPFRKSGRIVYRFRKSVGCEKGKIGGFSFQGGLKRVVV